MKRRLTTLVLTALAALSVTACGLRGELERPPPMWGDPPAQDETAEDASDSGETR
ncbi:MAG: argininosuccinate lyase [Pseudomonadota bacterium]|nr:argininosuccinate lyase [Pseudomonadota bacterium]